MTVTQENSNEYNIECFQNARLFREIEWIDDDTLEPVDLTGATLYMQVRQITYATFLQPYSLGVAVLDIDSTGDSLSPGVDETLGIVTIDVEAGAMNIAPGRYNYDLRADYGGGEIDIVAAGYFDVKPGITS